MLCLGVRLAPKGDNETVEAPHKELPVSGYSVVESEPFFRNGQGTAANAI